METTKSSRHGKISGDFGEMLVLYWLSKDGFECVRVDHTGIDLTARNPHNQELMGISVKCRNWTRAKGTETVTVKSNEFEKARAACTAFGCNPYFAFVVDVPTIIRVFIVSLPRFVDLFPPAKSGSSDWRTSEFHQAK